jgi:surfactin synthase thioesterase subunit
VRAPGHIATRPGASRHLALRLMTDVELLLAQVIADVRMNQPVNLYEQPAGTLSACASCAAAYERARRLIEQSGGLAQWMEKMCGPGRASG